MNQVSTVPISDGGLHLVSSGQGSTVVLLHSGQMDHTMWDELAAALEPDHRVLRFDARSQGRSSTATVDYDPVEDLLAVLDRVGGERVTLVGCSMGGMTAVDFAHRYPERTTSPVLIGAEVPPVDQSGDEFLRFWHEEQEAAVRAGSLSRWVEALLRFSVDGPHRAPSEVDPRMRERCRRMAEATVAAHHTATGQPVWREVRPHLSQITAPTLVVTGELEVGAIRETADLLEAQQPDVERVDVPGVGHMVMLEAPDRTAELVRRHLAGQRDRADARVVRRSR